MGKGIFDFLAPILGTVAGSFVGMPWLGAAIGSGLNTGIKTGNPLAGALSAGGSLVGGGLGGAASSAIGGLGSASLGSVVNSGLGGGIGGDIGQSALGSLGGASLGSIAGSSAGSSLGGMAGQSILPKAGMPSNNPPTFTPTQAKPQDLPSSLSSLANLDPSQQASNIATQAVYGGGVGSDESNYFTNLLNRQLVDKGGKVNPMSSVNPVENNFLSQLGLGGSANSNQLLKKLKGYSAT